MMGIKTMEGLAGARTNMNMIKVPLRVYKEAERRGDMGTMERAMGYVSEFSSQAQEYKEEAYEGMKEDGKEAREREEAVRQEAAARLKEERENSEERTAESRKDSEETLKISREGKALWENATKQEAYNQETGKPVARKENVIYTKTGEVSIEQPDSDTSIFV